MRSYWIRVGPYAMTGFLIKSGEFGHTDIQGEYHVMTKTNIRVV